MTNMQTNDMTYDPTKYDRPSVTVDTVLLKLSDKEENADNVRCGLDVLLVKRTEEPFAGQWCLPGSFVNTDETLEDAARRGLADKTGVDFSEIFTEQLYTFGEVERDPRMRIISVSYMGIVRSDSTLVLEAGKNASEVAWGTITRHDSGDIDITVHCIDGDVTIPASHLAFDHENILECAISRIANKVEYTDIAFNFLAHEFTLGEVMGAYEAILSKRLDKSNFRKFIKRFVNESGKYETGVAHRPSKIYTLNGDWSGVPWK